MDRIIRAIVYRLPRRFIYWATIRLWVHGTTGEFSSTVVGELELGEALKRWEGMGTPDLPISAEEEAFLQAGIDDAEDDKPDHAFQGRSDRWCEICGLPDRNPVHTGESDPGWPPQDGGY